MPRDILQTTSNQLSVLIKDKNLPAILLIDEATQKKLYNFVDDNGNSPLMVAASTPDNELIIAHILKRFNNMYILNTNTNTGKNALMLAFKSNSEGNISELLNNIQDFDDINVTSKEYKTVLDYADESEIDPNSKAKFINKLEKIGATRSTYRPDKRGGSLRSKTHKRSRKHNSRRSTKQRKRRPRN